MLFPAPFLSIDPVVGRWRGGLVVDLTRLDGSARARRVAAEASAVRYGLIVAADGTFRLSRGVDRTVKGTWIRKEGKILFRYPDPVNPRATAEQAYRLEGDRLVHRPNPKERPSARIEFRRLAPSS